MNKQKIINIKQGFTLIELMVVVALVAIPLMVVGSLLMGSTRGFQRTYNSVHSKIQQDAMATMAAFGTVGRKSNRANYKIYTQSGLAWTEATPQGDTTVFGQAVEFRYWAQPFDPQNPSADAIDITNTGTHYAFFYLDDTSLKVDYGQVVNGVGAVNGTSRVTTDITTQVLAENLDTSLTSKLFSHDVVGGVGMGCVRLNMTLQSDEGDEVDVKTATMLRVIWPR